MIAKRLTKGILFVSISSLMLYAANALAASSDIGGIATNISGTFGALAKLITAISYIAGMGFAMAAILKFKAHKDNPSSIPIGTPIALIFVAAALLFLPTMFGIAGQTLFQGAQSAGGISGVTTF